MACGWLGERREGNYLLGEPPSVRVAGNSPSTGTEASHCSQWSRGNPPVALIPSVLIRPKLDFVVARARLDFSSFFLFQDFNRVAKGQRLKELRVDVEIKSFFFLSRR